MQQVSQAPYQVLTNQQPSQPTQVRTHSSEISSYPKRYARIFGYLELLIGQSCIVFEAIYLGAFTGICLISLGAGLWTGLLHLLTGIFGVLTAKEANRCRVITFMVFAIISSVAAVVGGISAIGYSTALIIGGEEPNSSRPTPCPYIHAFMPQLLLCICQTSQLSLALASSIICCRAVCCGEGVLTSAGAQAQYHCYAMEQALMDQGKPVQPVQGGGYYNLCQHSLGDQHPTNLCRGYQILSKIFFFCIKCPIILFL